MVRFERFQSTWDQTKVRIIAATNGKPALVDMTGVGDSIFEDLHRKAGNFSGFVFTQRSKQDLMELLQAEIQQTRLGLTGEVLLGELESFEYEFKARDNRYVGTAFSAPPGMHDDCVCALALAVKHLGPRGSSFVFARVPFEVAVGIEGGEPDPTQPSPQLGFERAGPSWEDRGGLVP